MNYTYILECNQIEKRVKDHNAGKGAKYTKSRLPVKLVYLEESATKEEAMRREYAIKQLSRQEKEELIKKAEPENRSRED